MNCELVRHKLHEFIDVELCPTEMAAISEHVEQCVTCGSSYDRVNKLRRGLAQRHLIPAAEERKLLKRIRRGTRFSLWRQLHNGWDCVYTFWRDLDSGPLLAKLGAVPVTIFLFGLVLYEFAPHIDYLAFSVYAVEEQPSGIVKNLELRQESREIVDRLQGAAFKLPYEDSLSVIAEIAPDGSAEIGDILEYPRSVDLLDAVNVALRRNRFRSKSERGHAHVIFSFQKIDVYEQQYRGL